MRLAKFGSLATDEWEKSHNASALNGIGEISLMLRSHTGLLSADDSSMRVQKLLQQINILIVDVFYIILGKVTLFIHFNNLFFNLYF